MFSPMDFNLALGQLLFIFLFFPFGWEYSPCAIVSWKYITRFFISQRLTAEFALNLRENSGILSNAGTIKTSGTLGEELTVFCIMR